MITFTRFHKEHLSLIHLQPAQMEEAAYLRDPKLAAEAEAGTAFSAWRHNVECIGCAGFVPIFPTRSALWAVLGVEARDHMVSLVRFGKWMLREFAPLRTEAYVAPEFEQGHRFLRMIGMECEHPRLRHYNPMGQDVAMYAKVRE